MAKSLSFQEVVIATAKHKVAAARSRPGAHSYLEKPKEAILDALIHIADELKPHRYVFQKSGPKLKRVDGDLTFEIVFQSDRNNIAGIRAAIWIHAGVYSQILSKWRRSHPNPWIHQEGPYAGRVAGAQIGNLSSSPGWMEWDFADEGNRAQSREDAVKTIRELIFPFFERFNDTENCVATLMQHRVLWSASVIEYALSKNAKFAAELAIQSFLKANADLQEAFGAARSEFMARGVPKVRSGPIRDLAALVVAAGLNIV